MRIFRESVQGSTGFHLALHRQHWLLEFIYGAL